jgi:hypothetical protein
MTAKKGTKEKRWTPGYVKKPWGQTLHGNWYSLEKKIQQSVQS